MSKKRAPVREQRDTDRGDGGADRGKRYENKTACRSVSANKRTMTTQGSWVVNEREERGFGGTHA